VNFSPLSSQYSNVGLGQSFIATVEGQLDQIDIKTDQSYNNVRLYIYSTSNGSGIQNNVGSPVYTQLGINLTPNLLDDPNDWNAIALDNPFPVIAGNTYSFVISHEIVLTPILLGVDFTNDYSFGTLIKEFGVNESIWDLNFRIWETPNPPPPGPTPTPLSAWPAAIAILALVAIKLLRK
jgi:hypothetical protein